MFDLIKAVNPFHQKTVTEVVASFRKMIDELEKIQVQSTIESNDLRTRAKDAELEAQAAQSVLDNLKKIIS